MRLATWALWSCIVVGNTAIAQEATHTSEFGSGGVITVNSVKRSASNSVIVKGTIKNTSSSKLSFGQLVESAMVKPHVIVKLQDPEGKKEFGAVTVEGQIVGSTHADTSLDPNQQVTFWSRITAPAPEIKTASVIFSGEAPPIEGVPILE